MREEFQLRLQEGDESLLFEIPEISPIVAESIDLRSTALNTPARTLRRSLKRKRAEEDSDARTKFLEIAEKQADALRMLAESNKQSVEVAKQQAETLKPNPAQRVSLLRRIWRRQ